jgi:hypothetical protein
MARVAGYALGRAMARRSAARGGLYARADRPLSCSPALAACCTAFLRPWLFERKALRSALRTGPCIAIIPLGCGRARHWTTPRRCRWPVPNTPASNDCTFVPQRGLIAMSQYRCAEHRRKWMFSSSRDSAPILQGTEQSDGRRISGRRLVQGLHFGCPQHAEYRGFRRPHLIRANYC